MSFSQKRDAEIWQLTKRKQRMLVPFRSVPLRSMKLARLVICSLVSVGLVDARSCSLMFVQVRSFRFRDIFEPNTM